MKLSALGEDAVVAALTKNLPAGTDVRCGVGDDCAVIGGPRDTWWQLLKTDCVVEGIHFLAGEKPQRVGWKALCRAISDVAAMGGIPQHAMITIAVRRDVELRWLEGLYAGLRRAARRFDVSIVGGETSRSPGPAFVSIALTGKVERKKCAMRSGGRPGDAILVTGRLGGSLARRHLAFTPRVCEARWLVEHFEIHAMMDLSDGLAMDLPRLAEASECGFAICEEKLPLNRGCSVRQALADGEDFELLLAVSPRAAERLCAAWKRAFPRLPLTRIGDLTTRQSRSAKTRTNARGYDHFA